VFIYKFEGNRKLINYLRCPFMKEVFEYRLLVLYKKLSLT